MSGDGGGREDLVVRTATADDVDLLAALERAAFGEEAWSPAQVLGTLDSPHWLGLLALPASSRRASPLGYAVFQSVADEAELLRVGVDPPARRHGVAARLLGAGLDLLIRRGVRRCVLEVAVDNRPAIALYERLDFAACGRRPGYYPGGRDARLYERSLTAPGVPAERPPSAR